jgi:hypothetical protein
MIITTGYINGPPASGTPVTFDTAISALPGNSGQDSNGKPTNGLYYLLRSAQGPQSTADGDVFLQPADVILNTDYWPVSYSLAAPRESFANGVPFRCRANEHLKLNGAEAWALVSIGAARFH